MAGTLKDSVVSVQDSMINLMEGLQESGADQATMKELASLVQGFRSFVSENLGQGEPQAAQQPMRQQTVSPEMGAARVQPSMQ